MARAKRRGVPLGARIFAVSSLLIIGTAGSGALVTWWRGQAQIEEAVTSAMTSHVTVQTAFQQQRFQQLQLMSRIFQTDEGLTALLLDAAEVSDVAAILDVVEIFQNILAFDVAVLLDPTGRVVTRTDDPGAAGADFYTNPLIAGLRGSELTLGVWQEAGKLYNAVGVPLVREFELVGYILVGFAINEAHTLRIERVSGAETVFLANTPTGPAVAASTLSPQLGDELIAELRRGGEALNRVLTRGETVDRVPLVLDGGRWMAVLTPLRGAAEETVGAAVGLIWTDTRLRPSLEVIAMLASAAGLAMAVAAVMSWLIGRGFQKPIRQLAEALEAGRQGRYDAPRPKRAGGDVGRLVGAGSAMLDDLWERHALEGVVALASRHLPEPARAETPSRPEARKGALVAVEMRRFATPKVGYDPEESLGRFARDLRRVLSSVQSHRGRLEAVAGHRVLISFDGEGAAFQALTAATEVLRILSEPENVFDEPEPPVVVLTTGTTVSGTVASGDRQAAALLGLPVQQLESLLREAPQGEVLLSKQLHRELAEKLAQAGASARELRGILTPQPLFALSLDEAAKATGVESAPAVTTAFPGEQRSLSEISTGTVLGDRFEVQAELGAGPLGVTFKAHDRAHGQMVSLKLLKPEIGANPVHVDRLRSQIRQARSVQHPNVAGVLDVGEVDGLIYVATQLVRGITLRFLLETAGPMSPLAAVAMGRQLAAALAITHMHRVLHLRLKPENVLLEGNGQVRLLDLGQALGNDPGAAAYLAPEQLEGAEVDVRTDIFAWGVVFYESLTGKVPFAGASATDVRLKQIEEPPQPPSRVREDVPAQVDDLALRCLAREKAQRAASAEELVRALESLRR